MKLKEFHETIIPAAKALAGSDNPAEILKKAACMVGDMPLTDEEGNPVEVDQITLMPAAKAAPEPAEEVLPEDEPVKGSAEAIEKAVKAAVDAAIAKMPKPTRTIPQQIDTGTPKKFTIPATVKHYVPRHFKGERFGYGADERAFRFGMWALSSISKQIPGRFSFPAADKFVKEHGIEVKLSSEGVNSAGGYLVPEEFGTDLIDLREQYGVVRRLFKRRPMMGDTRTDPRRVSGLTAYFVSEGGAGTESPAKVWDQVRLTAKDVMVISRMTAQLSADAVINIGDDLAQEVSYAFANKEDECGFNGDGGVTYGGIVGARTAINNLVTGTGMITQATSNTWAAMVLTDFEAVVGVLPQYADPGAVWVVHRAFYYNVMKRLELAAGGATATETVTGNRSGRPLFLGYPVEISQVMPAATAVTTIAALLGDFTMGASFGDRQQDSIAFSEHATIGGENVFERNEIAIRGVERFDINVHDVGSTTAAGPICALKSGT